MAKLDKFDPENIECLKCGNTEVKLRYKESDKRGREIGGYLELYCTRCGYMWKCAPVDTPEEEPSP